MLCFSDVMTLFVNTQSLVKKFKVLTRRCTGTHSTRLNEAKDMHHACQRKCERSLHDHPCECVCVVHAWVLLLERDNANLPLECRPCELTKKNDGTTSTGVSVTIVLGLHRLIHILLPFFFVQPEFGAATTARRRR